jgi:hypothetical protein
MQDGIQSLKINTPHVPVDTEKDGTIYPRVPKYPNKDIFTLDGIDDDVDVPCDVIQNPKQDGFQEVPSALNPLLNLDSLARSQTPADLETVPVIIDYLQSIIELLKLKAQNMKALHSKLFRPVTIPVTHDSTPSVNRNCPDSVS